VDPTLSKKQVQDSVN
jgi:Ca2+-binding EF-hand superfamily protein